MRGISALTALLAVAGLAGLASPAMAGVAHAASGPAAGHLAAAKHPPEPPRALLNIVKTASVQSFSGPNQTITFTYTVSDPGNIGMNNVLVTDSIPATGVNIPVSCPGGNPIPSLGISPATVTCTGTYTTTATDDTNGSITDDAVASGNADLYGNPWPANSSLTIPLVGTPFPCTNATTPMYFLAQEKNNTNSTEMWHTTNTNNPWSYNQYPGSAYTGGYNAIGFDPANDFIYGIDGQNNLLTIDSSGIVTNVQPIQGGPLPTGSNAPVVGAFGPVGSNGSTFYVAEGGGGSSTMWEINVVASQPIVTGSINFTDAQGNPANFTPDDWTWGDIGTTAAGYLWGLAGNTLYQVSPTGVISTYDLSTTSGISTDPGDYGAAWTYENGDLGFSNNTTGHIYRIAVGGTATSPTFSTPLSNPDDYYSGPGQATMNDGTASCGTATSMVVQGGGTGGVPTNGDVAFSVKVANLGPAVSSGFVLRDKLTGPISHLYAYGSGCTADSKTKTVQCLEGVLDNKDTFNLAVVGTAPATAGKCITSTATVYPNEVNSDPKGATSKFKTCVFNPKATWTASPGGVITAKSAGAVTLADTSTGTDVTCKSSAVAGTVKKGTGLAGTALASITKLSLTGCAGDGLTVNGTANALPWDLNTQYYAKGAATGTVTGIDATLSGAGCTATLDGTAAGADNGQVDVSYTNSSGTLTVLPTGGNLTLGKVSGCAGLLKSGDGMTLSGSYKVGPGQTLTSP
jgi:uncharacterized repeat protein (TIGR01451 family)